MAYRKVFFSLLMSIGISYGMFYTRRFLITGLNPWMANLLNVLLFVALIVNLVLILRFKSQSWKFILGLILLAGLATSYYFIQKPATVNNGNTPRRYVPK